MQLQKGERQLLFIFKLLKKTAKEKVRDKKEKRRGAEIDEIKIW